MLLYGGRRWHTLWPLSRKDRPKQFLRLVGDQSMYQIAINRILRLFSTDHIFIVTIASQVEGLHEEFPSIPMENFIIEPMPKGTASVVGLAASYLLEKDPNAVMAILTADHIIEDIQLFNHLLEEGVEQAQAGHLVTLGIEPTYASTGYGYIRAGKALSDGQELQAEQFVEKPNEETAKKYLLPELFLEFGHVHLESGRYHGGIRKANPELFTALLSIREHIRTGNDQEFIPEIWTKLKSQTIDYGIMEHAKDVVVLPARGLGWNDVGSWDSLFEILSADENGNVISSENIIQIGSNNTLYHTENADKLIALIDVNDLLSSTVKKLCWFAEKDKRRKSNRLLRKLERGIWILIYRSQPWKLTA
jgi:mannose-1-phosphate guanylyltransferase